jgi:spore coat protein CotH
VKKHPDAKLYDAHVLRTLFFEFENKDWEEELEDFHGTDVDVPARMIVDGKAYANVGLRFRGTSSYGGVPRGQKRSFNVTVDLADKKQNLYGYKTLNLLNAHEDPSFLRSVLFNHIARHYIPAPEANLVRVVINGESWGVYTNEEQFNKDFVQKWFGNGDGPRWKVPPNFSGAAALVYHGDDAAEYRGMYEIKAKDEDQAWRDLIALCKKLQETPDDKLETELAGVLDIDRALWFLALDNVLGDGDGYYSRGSDYVIYQDTTSKRFHIMPRDSNETFRSGGGPGGPGGPGGAFGQRGGPGGDRGPAAPGGGGPDGIDVLIRRGPGNEPAQSSARGGREDERSGGPGRGGPARGGRGGGPGGPAQDPLAQVEANNRPLVTRLLNNKKLRARYLAHVRTIVDEWLNWEALGPVFEDYRALIADDVMRDTRNLSTFAEFFDADIGEAAGGGPFGAPPGIKRFVDERRAFLLNHAELKKPHPTIVAVRKTFTEEANGGATPQKGVEVAAHVADQPPAETVLLYYAVGRNAPFQSLEMKKAEGQSQSARPNESTYTATIPGAAAGARVYYYVEARAAADLGTTTFAPAHAEFVAADYRVSATASSSPATDKRATVVINELMAVNNRTIKDPQGKFADWIELLNAGSEEADLSGLHLTTSKDKPRKWKFPSGTKLAPGERLIVWADSDSKAKPGLHANFKLAKSGEAVYLTDRNERGNAILDGVEFGEQRADVAWGRFPEGAGKWQLLPPTPGAPNVAGK